ncbi:histidine ABC transporter permease HisQ [Chromobacterium subtsugae]|uniref:Histidine ABC transporter permease HisQ n=1 Tax=Chromobacterium subtsugae TaxID=251747 RepID=A0ABS7FGH4_9NEIS|nr:MULTISPECIES: histidine ABC transporter permease HisQ [Chromobacterium]KUM01968.1 histidine ABC transporter permease [Chromobacterium subtsugae]KZE85497.1 histidine ABC transporter permease [Chromobacterium sp. F49]MBW7567531.1 histidine ABC transporter permease HisQ [Chromobacterium subtsugae]MBW8288841.1 histidine ABC transporter permease HisQ [Chromobacterium subtsugae]OBU87035.1 histidine ABC transporter permease [Chromobacterium subtsugae]
MFLDGFGPIIWQGTLVTLELSVLSLLLAFVIGLAGAGAKLSSNPVLGGLSTIYTTLVRGVPDLVLMLLIFYSLQIGMNKLTDALHIDQIDLDPFVSGIVTLGFIYGAYFTETLRGAFLSVPKGQIEAGIAYGMSHWQVFSRVQFPQMMRFALPGISNNWQVMLKATALVSIIGLADVVKASVDAGKSTYKVFFFTLVAGAIYLLLTTLSNFVLMKLERRYSMGVREAEL